MAEVKHQDWKADCGFHRHDPKMSCSVRISSGVISVKTESEAHLIAAAPDMFEALREAKGLADMAEMYDGPGEPSEDQKSLIELRAMIDAALAKATAQ